MNNDKDDTNNQVSNTQEENEGHSSLSDLELLPEEGIDSLSDTEEYVRRKEERLASGTEVFTPLSASSSSQFNPISQIDSLSDTEEYVRSKLERMASGTETFKPISASSSSTSQSTAEFSNLYQKLLQALTSQPDKINSLEKKIAYLEMDQKVLQNNVTRLEEQVRVLTAQLSAQQQVQATAATQPTANTASQQTNDKQSAAPTFFANRRNSM